MQKRWLFVTYTPDPKRPYLDASARYRCFNRAEDLRNRGIAAAVMSQQRFMREPPMDFDFYVFHRPWYTQDFEGLLNYLRRRGKRLLADYDAPVFSQPFHGPSSPPFPEMPVMTGAVEERFAQALRLFDTVAASTPVLAEEIGKLHPHARAHVIDSGLANSWREMADALYRFPADERSVVGVGVGTEFQLDEALLGRVLPRALDSRKDLRLMMETRLRKRLALPDDRTQPRPIATGGHAVLGRSHTLIFPLARNPWNESLSPVRALEAAYLGCRVIATPLPLLLEHRDAGIEFAGSEEAWLELLNQPAPQAEIASPSPTRREALNHGGSALQTRRLLELCGGGGR